MLSTTFVGYAHVVFTVPRLLAKLALQNKRLIYSMLFRLSAEALIEAARNPEHLGAEIGFFSVLHTWTQRMEHHPHVHCVVPAGGLSFDHGRWVSANPRYRFFLPLISPPPKFPRSPPPSPVVGQEASMHV